jgi:acetylornithine deacetylase
LPKKTWRGPLHFAFTYDEEVGCLGARALIEDLASLGIRPSAVIIGEPTDMRIIEGHKGCFEYTTRFAGSGGHASQPDAGVNAIEFAMRYLERLLSLREPLKARAPSGSRFEPPWTTLQAGAISGGPARNVVASECQIDWEMRPVTAADADFVKADIAGFVDEVLRPAMHRIDPACEIVTHVVGEVEGWSRSIRRKLCGSRAN